MAPPTKRQTSRVLERETSSIKSRISTMSLAAGDMDWSRGKILLKPDDQLQLTEEELQEEIARVLTIHNTRTPDSLVEWSWKQKEFIKLPDPPHIVTLLSVPGTILHKDSEEAKLQMAGYHEDIEFEKVDMMGGGEEEYEGDYDELQSDDFSSSHRKSKQRKIPNQFNFCERAALTYDNPMRNVSTQTIPPPTKQFNTHIFQWTIFDEYQEDYEPHEKGKLSIDKKIGLIDKKIESKKKREQAEIEATNARMLQAAKTLERMVNQNIFDEIAQDYKYWDDPSDEYKEKGEGSLLPLWKFLYEPTKKHDVTDLCFNSRYYDLFAVSFGTMGFNDTLENGAVCLFSLKNPSYPEWVCSTESPAMCVDFSIQHPHLLVSGWKDGSVAVYNIMLPATGPQYKSNEVTQKHGGVVWEVRWGPDTEEGNLAFYSVSVDGNVNYWTLNQNELGLTIIMTLYLNRPPIPGPDGTLMTLKGCGTCMTFFPKDPQIFLIGTEEGTMYKCNTTFSSVYVQTYNEAHNMPIYRIVFNKYDPSVFASCSGDWRIKIWEDGRLEPLFVFDLGVPIGDVQWAPYSSTVFACVSNDGKVAVFDLNVNKYRPICNQAVISKRRGKLTRLAFNNDLPFIIVGDDKGTISALKLSPNLRIRLKPSKKQIDLTERDLEIMKLEKLLSFVREPPVLTPPPDVRRGRR